jgi:hypothetical protein
MIRYRTCHRSSNLLNLSFVSTFPTALRIPPLPEAPPTPEPQHTARHTTNSYHSSVVVCSLFHPPLRLRVSHLSPFFPSPALHPSTMRTSAFLLTALSLGASLVSASSDVVDLTQSTFDDFVQSDQARLIEFFAPWSVPDPSPLQPGGTGVLLAAVVVNIGREEGGGDEGVLRVPPNSRPWWVETRVGGARSTSRC